MFRWRHIEADPLTNAMADLQDLERIGGLAAYQHQMVGKAAEAAEHDFLVRRQRLPWRQGRAPLELQGRNVVAQDRRFRFFRQRNHSVTRNAQQLQHLGADD
jgi:hypothetical protein